MTCPKCKNEDFEPSEDIARPVVNLGGKTYTSDAALRRYACLQCGYAWESIERHNRPLELRTRRDLFSGKEAA